MPQDRELLRQSANLLLDCNSFVAITGGDLQSFTLGSLSGFADPDVAKKIRTRITDTSQFDDLMLELSIAGFHQGAGHRVTPHERNGWPDIEVLQPSVDDSIFVECKRLTSHSPKRLPKVISKANSQLRAVPSTTFGIVLVDITESIGVQPLSDDLLAPVQVMRDMVMRTVAGPKNRSVDRIILTWDDYGVVPGAPGRVVAVLRRRFLNIDHEPVEGTRQVPHNLTLFSGSTVAMAVERDDQTAA